MTRAGARQECRLVVHRPAFDTLEQRALLSVGAPTAAADVAVMVYRGPVETAPVGNARQAGRGSTTQNPESGVSESSGSDKPADGKDDSARIAPHGADGASPERRIAHDDAGREIAGSIPFMERRTIDETAPIDSSLDGAVADPEPTSGLVGNDELDLQAEASVVAWAPGSALSSGLASASSVEPAAMGAVVWGPENARPAVGSPQVPVGELGADPAQLADLASAADRVSPTSTWGNLVERALRGEWDAVDAELRQFLARLGGSGDGSDEHGFGPSWPLWIGTAMATILASHALRSPWRLWRRTRLAQTYTLREHPVPADPWPLSSS